MKTSSQLKRLVAVTMLAVVGLSLTACESTGKLQILRDDTYTVEMTVAAPKNDKNNLNCEEISKIFDEASEKDSGSVEDLSTDTQARCRIKISKPQPITSAVEPFPVITKQDGKYRVTLAPDLIKKESLAAGTQIDWRLIFPGPVLDISGSNGGQILSNNTVQWTDPSILYRGFTVVGGAAIYSANTAAATMKDIFIAIVLYLVALRLMKTTFMAKLWDKTLMLLDRAYMFAKRVWIKFYKALPHNWRRRLIHFGYFWKGVWAFLRRPFRKRSRARRRRQRQQWLESLEKSPWSKPATVATYDDEYLTGDIPIVLDQPLPETSPSPSSEPAQPPSEPDSYPQY